MGGGRLRCFLIDIVKEVESAHRAGGEAHLQQAGDFLLADGSIVIGVPGSGATIAACLRT